MERLFLLGLYLFYAGAEVGCFLMSTGKPDVPIDLSSLMSHVTALEEMFKAQEAKSADLELQVKILTSDLRNTKMDLQQTKSELQLLQQNNSVSVKEIDSVRQELTAVKTELGMILKDTNSVKPDISELKTELLSLKMNNTWDSRELVSVKQELVAMKMELDMTSNVANAVNVEVQNLQMEVLSLSANYTEIVQELTSVQQDLTTVKTEANMTSIETKEARSEIQNLQNGLFSLKTNLNVTTPDKLEHDVQINSAYIHQLRHDVVNCQELQINNSKLAVKMIANMADVQSQLHAVIGDFRRLESNVSSLECVHLNTKGPTHLTETSTQESTSTTYTPTTSSTTTTTITTTKEATSPTTVPITTTAGVPPKVFIVNKTLEVFYGQNVTLTCNVTGSPEPTITWDYDTNRVFNAEAHGNTLNIIYASYDNTGRYVCTADNIYGLHRGAIEVTAHRPLHVHMESPVVVLDPAAGFGRVECEAGSGSTPQFEWTKYNDNDFLSDPMILNTGDELIFATFTDSDYVKYTGLYVCHAKEGSQTADLIQVAAGLVSKPLDETKTFKDISVQTGAAFKATCPPGSGAPDGTKLTSGFEFTAAICGSARKVGVLDKGAGDVVWYIRKDGKAEFVDQKTGLSTISG